MTANPEEKQRIVIFTDAMYVLQSLDEDPITGIFKICSLLCLRLQGQLNLKLPFVRFLNLYITLACLNFDQILAPGLQYFL